MSSDISDTVDVEAQAGARTPLTQLEWRNITVTVKDHNTKQPLHILEGVTGTAIPGMTPLLLLSAGNRR